MRKQFYIAIVIFLLLFNFRGFAQEKVWTKVKTSEISQKLLRKEVTVNKYKTFTLDIDVLKSKLLPISKKASEAGSVILQFPDNQGNLLKFNVKENSLLHPDLAKKFPLIKSYSGQGIEDKSSSIYFTLNPLGLYAMILSPKNGTTYIDPYTADRKKYMVYAKKDAMTSPPFECLTESKISERIKKTALKNANDLMLRTFRLAIATTEEYSNFHVNAAGLGGGSTRNDSIAAVLSAITITMARVNPIFERDVALTMQLVANNDQLIFLETDSGEDPYSNDDGSAMLTQNQTTVDNIIGVANYDIGHVFSTGGGGVAFLASPCGNSKAGGVTGSVSPVGDSFDIDLVIHEMGHQYGANHTFNGTTSNCNGNRNNDTAVEPGSGSTIMAYAGICAPQNIQNNSDAYFHKVSIQEMFDNITVGDSQCGVESDFITNLDVPTANAGNNYTIPKSTPFVLNGQGFDADGNEITYCWEQIDNEVTNIQIPPSSTQTEGAVFRSFEPDLSSNRYMPKLTTVISGSTASMWEVVPDVSRTLNFSLTVRDNVVGEGQTASDDMIVTVNDIAGPFTVTSQNVAGIIWAEGDPETITWNVAGTNANDINVTNVNILLSLDGGLTFPITLASNTPNDGQETITVPNSIAPDVRVMVEAVGNIFYAVNSEPFSIGSFETTCTIYDANDVPLNIPDNNTTGITSTINVLNDFTITDVNVSVDITHTWLWDLQIYLESPDGTEVLIYDRSCGSSGLQRQGINAIFDDDATSMICDDAIPAISGTTKPDNLLSSFNGLSSFGDWKLRVVDNAPADLGTLNSWSIELCETNQTASVDNSKFKQLSIYPNPFNNSFTLSLNASSFEDVIITLYDVRGRTIMRKGIRNPSTFFEQEFNFSYLSNGIYILKIQKGIAKAAKKIVKY